MDEERVAGKGVVLLPEEIEACLFDLDGVLTETAELHAEAWKTTFDDYLHGEATRAGGRFRPFDAGADYEAYVDGRERYDGVRAFLASRGIELPEGSPDDSGSVESVAGLGNRKNDRYLSLLRERGVRTFPGSLRFVRTVREGGLGTAVVSASRNCREVLRAAGIEELFEARVDGVTLAEKHLAGKPAPDSFLEAARRLGVEPARAAVFEDAPAGVAAGRAGGFRFVVGVDRHDEAETLREEGADAVVSDLAELLA
ncbi:MAG TPA: beta-phosphoglucomutase family hydrolase [Gaiellaceae bacterium]|jgi:beta-phosphoglucomutase family hydrolase|nr:beta-phosphoglucomutase family hydrolase [Gaiellaceae bacterium]